jgi:DNA-binding transcriptional MerR regulator
MAETRDPSQLYSIKELERLTGLPRRTIHYYVKEGMIPPPDGTGRNARYGEEHRLRLILIREMRDSTYLRLEGIREIIETMTEDDLHHWIERLEEGDDMGAQLLQGTRPELYAASPEDADASHGPLEAGPPPETDEVAAEKPALMHQMGRSRKPFASLKTRTWMARGALRSRAGDASPETGVGETDAWNRVRVSDDVEIHFRSSGDDNLLEKIRRVVAYARKILR